MERSAPIGVFDSGYGGLTVFKSIVEKLPQYQYIYLGDNARSPYGDHSFETVYNYTLECVEWLFAQGCRLVILACNTASAKALRNIQQLVLPKKYPNHRVLGVIRPTAEVIGNFSKTNTIGVLGTRGTINSNSYAIEIEKFFPDITIQQQSCPMWVPLIENDEHNDAGADYFVKKYLDLLLTNHNDIDTILLACTHYPLLIPKIKNFVEPHIQLVAQGDIVAASLQNYLERHTEIESQICNRASVKYFTSGDAEVFGQKASIFMGNAVTADKVDVNKLTKQ
jgi:glutamate racemase